MSITLDFVFLVINRVNASNNDTAIIPVTSIILYCSGIICMNIMAIADKYPIHLIG